ncbi:MAG: C40 family peptidase [Mycobacteriales bacterium]
MPHVTQRVRFALLRAGLITTLSATIVGAYAGIATADTSPTPTDGSSTSQSPSDGGTTGTDPGQVSSPADPADPAAGTTDTTGTSSSRSTITFGEPRAVASGRTAHMRSVRARHQLEVRAVLKEASRQRGKPYRYGGAGPSSFDCSGLVRYVFGHAVGRWLPHNAAAQYHSIAHIKRSELQPGDLVFQESHGYVFHVGIYAGHGKWWHAPHTGSHVQEQRIYSGHKYYGRVLTNGFANRHTHRRH